MNNAPSASAKTRLLSAVACALLPLCAGCDGVLTTSDRNFDQERLAPCTGADTEFADIEFNEWQKTYHEKVAVVIDEHLKSLQETNTQQLECTAADYSSMIKPTDKLKELARDLAPWKEQKDLEKLSEMDIGSVLLEYLRVYECALNERKNFISIIVPKENSSAAGRIGISMHRVPYNKKTDEQRRDIDHELAVSRPILDRTLILIGGEDRLRPLALDVECLKRVSLDIRNIVGLVSQASACLPRIRDARGSLRDLPDPTQ